MTWFKKYSLELSIFLIAFALRLLYFWQISDAPAFGIPLLDSEAYHQLAQKLLSTEPLNYHFFWQPVFYPLYLAAIYTVTGGSIAAAIIIQMAVDALTCVLIYGLGVRFLNKASALSGALIYAFYAPAIFFSGELLASTWAAFWGVVLLITIVKAAERPTILWLFLSGCAAGMGVVIRPTYLPISIILILWLLGAVWPHSRSIKKQASLISVVILGMCLFLVPLGLAKKHLVGVFGFTPTSGGINLYVGNNPDRCATIQIRPGNGWRELINMPDYPGEHNAVLDDKYFKDKFLSYITYNPLNFISGIAYKSFQLLNSYEVPRNVDIYNQRNWSGLLKLGVWHIGPIGFPFILLLPLAVFGGIVHFKKLPLPLFLFLLFYSGSIVLVFVASRYKMPLIPFLSLLAGAGAMSIFKGVKASGKRGLYLSAFAAAAVVLVISGIPASRCEAAVNYEAELYYNLGSALFKSKDYEKGHNYLEKAIALDPNHGSAHYNIGIYYDFSGNWKKALGHYGEALRIFPGHKNARAFILKAYLKQTETSDFKEFMADYVKVDEDFSSLLFMTAELSVKTKQYLKAIKLLNAHIQLEQMSNNVCHLLGDAYWQSGNLDSALAVYNRGINLFEVNGRLYYKAADIYNRKGVYDEALAYIKKAIESAPGELQLQYHLIIYLKNRGHLAEARRALIELKKLSPEWAAKAAEVITGPTSK